MQNLITMSLLHWHRNYLMQYKLGYMKKSPNAINILSSLISANTKRYERYTTAADGIKEVNGKLVLINHAVQAQEFIAKLNKWLAAYDANYGEANKGNSAKSWSGLKRIFQLRGKKFILGHCEFVEQETLNIYRAALVENVLLSATVIDLQKQIDELEEARLTLKALKESSFFPLQVA